jgi:hypothetical protein
MKTAYLSMAGLVFVGAALSVLKGGRGRTVEAGIGDRMTKIESEN